MASIINATTTNGVAISADNSGILQLATNSGTTAVTIDASQNVGIGTATLTSAKTTIYSASGSSDVGATNNAMYLNVGTPATTGNYIRFAGAVTTDLYYGRAVNSDAFVWGKVGGAESMRIDSSGNVGIGTASPAYKTVISNAGAEGFEVGVGYISGKNLYQSYNRATSAYVQADNSALLYTWSTSGTERMRIDSVGDVLIGQTSATSTPASGFCFNNPTGTTYMAVGHPTGTASGGSYAIFNYNSTSIGSITQNGTTAVLYNTTSDYRLKNDVAPIQNALTTIEALNPVSFTWIDGRPDDGFLAHELQAVLPNCVTGEKDAVNEDGTPKYQQMDNSGVIPFLVKAIQEQQALITTLQTQITALNAKGGI